MDAFLQKYGQDVTGCLNGWDRLMVRGTLRALAVTSGMMSYLQYVGVLLKDFGGFVERTSGELKAACFEAASRLGRPIRYLASSQTRKEEVAATIARTEGITQGLIGLLTCVEPCMSYSIRGDRAQKKLVLEPRLRKCLHIYHYWMDCDFGLMHARIQTWFPFSIQVCLNGRSWLAQQMDRLGLEYQRRDNCFVWLHDVAATQKLMDRLLQLNWPTFLDKIARKVNPILSDILRGYRVAYYWSVYESEWATDVMFRSPSALGSIYPSLARGAISAFGSADVLRFLGKRHVGERKEVSSSYRRRPEGLRVKHVVGSNSVKMYDKEGRVLRVETTVNDPRDMKVYRSGEGDSGGRRSWRRMRKGVVDLRRRAEVSQGCNERYCTALASLDTSEPLRELITPICRPVKLGRCRVRGLRPWAKEDLSLLRIVNSAHYSLTGFRNRDLAAALHLPMRNAIERRRASARVSQRLRLLRAHHLIRRLPHTHRYQLTARGRQIITAILQVQDVPVSRLSEIAA